MILTRRPGAGEVVLEAKRALTVWGLMAVPGQVPTYSTRLKLAVPRTRVPR
ncbi:hypothetical protein IQ238_03460 [Pleurocapsales cyanobacterium LEGE 06147]|nr:hypothetical protein [Pleurocapsales cyanobacterium LEGE 06147]